MTQNQFSYMKQFSITVSPGLNVLQRQVVLDDILTMIAPAIIQFRDAQNVITKVTINCKLTGPNHLIVRPGVIKTTGVPTNHSAGGGLLLEFQEMIDANLAVDYTSEFYDKHLMWNWDGDRYFTTWEFDLTKKAKKLANMVNNGQTPKEEFFPMFQIARSATAADDYSLNYFLVIEYQTVPKTKQSINVVTPT